VRTQISSVERESRGRIASRIAERVFVSGACHGPLAAGSGCGRKGV
jgi:hypothetical protein